MFSRYVASFWIPLALAALTSCSTLSEVPVSDMPRPLPVPEAGDNLVGFWHNKGAEAVPPYEADSVMDRRADGSFVIHFRRLDNGKRVIEEGRWSRNGDREWTLTTKQGEHYYQPPRQNGYTLLTSTRDLLRYRSDTSGRIFTARRVSNGYRMP